MPRRSTVRRSDEPFLLAMRLLRDELPSFDVYPLTLPAIRRLQELALGFMRSRRSSRSGAVLT
jgi:hypothetical protein